MARSQYSLPKSRGDDPRGLEGYIREAARKNGVDPDVAVRVAKSEGLRQFNSGVRRKDGTEEPSYGAFQLYTGGGLGNKFQKETGLDPKDPANEKATIDFAMKEAAKTGWGPWHGAKNTGIGDYEGIGGGAQAATAAPGGGIGSDAAASEGAATKMAGTDTSTITPDVAQTAPGGAPGDWLDKLKNASGSGDGLSTAITGLGQAITGSSAKNAAAAPAPATPIPVAMPTPQPVPMVDPNAVNNQRQQLALAMQRLNSGKLY